MMICLQVSSDNKGFQSLIVAVQKKTSPTSIYDLRVCGVIDLNIQLLEVREDTN